MKKVLPFIYLLCVCVFISGIIVGLFGRLICVRNNENYEVLQKEFKGPDVIAKVFQHNISKQIYVCYNDASYVNVYNSDGDFIWAVSTPYLRNCDFILTNETLIISGKESYVYNCHNGEFIRKTNKDDLNMEDSKYDDNTELMPGDLVYDAYNVYKYLGVDEYEAIIRRPGWHWIFWFPIDYLISFCAAFIVGVMFLIEKIREYHKEIKHQTVTKCPNCGSELNAIVDYTEEIQVELIANNIVYMHDKRYTGYCESGIVFEKDETKEILCDKPECQAAGNS